MEKKDKSKNIDSKLDEQKRLEKKLAETQKELERVKGESKPLDTNRRTNNKTLRERKEKKFKQSDENKRIDEKIKKYSGTGKKASKLSTRERLVKQQKSWAEQCRDAKVKPKIYSKDENIKKVMENEKKKHRETQEDRTFAARTNRNLELKRSREKKEKGEKIR
jgi:hypothetical protein